jgi:hypothetical protein
MHVVVTQEDTLFETELELVGIKWSKIGPIRTTKGASATVLGFFLKNIQVVKKSQEFWWVDDLSNRWLQEKLRPNI